MQVDEAQRILGVSLRDDAATVRAAYRRLLHRTHPDVSAVSDATDRTVRLTQAYAVLVERRPGASEPPTAPGSTVPDTGPTAGPTVGPTVGPTPAFPLPPEAPPVEAALVDADTIAVGAPPDEVLLLLVETAHQLGEISYLDPSAGLLEVIVEFVEAPTSSVLLSMQGRATDVTDVFCTVEPLSGGDAPPADAVTRLVLSTLVDVSQIHGPAGP